MAAEPETNCSAVGCAQVGPQYGTVAPPNTSLCLYNPLRDRRSQQRMPLSASDQSGQCAQSAFGPEVVTRVEVTEASRTVTIALLVLWLTRRTRSQLCQRQKSRPLFLALMLTMSSLLECLRDRQEPFLGMVPTALSTLAMRPFVGQQCQSSVDFAVARRHAAHEGAVVPRRAGRTGNLSCACCALSGGKPVLRWSESP